jgi:hypothetical protein
MKVAVLLVLASCVIAPSGSAEVGELDVEAMVFCTSVEDRTPVGEAGAFDNDIGAVCCFTKVIGAQEPTRVFHVWYYGDEEMARVELAVNSVSWRTWSTKKVLESWTGLWRVEVESDDGTVLESKEFMVRQPAPPQQD